MGVLQQGLVGLVHLERQVVVGEREVADDLGRALLDGGRPDDVGQECRAPFGQNRSNVPSESRCVDEGLAEEQVGVEGLVVRWRNGLSTSTAAGGS